MYEDSGNETCCSDDQFVTFSKQIAVPRELFRRCPSCFHNFMNIWCYLTCSPKQFMITNQLTTDNTTKKVCIDAVDFVISDVSANAMFNSCVNVQNPYANFPALAILCGTSTESCTVKGWLDYMGSTSNGQAPFNINFHISSTNITFNTTVLEPLKFKSVPCNQSLSNSTDPCSCQDCPASCAPTPPIPRKSRLYNVVMKQVE